MENPERPFMRTYGKINDDTLVCQYAHAANSKGLWFGDNPFDYSSPLLMAQIILIFFATRSLYTLLRPLGQSMVITYVIAGIIIGPSFLSRIKAFSDRLFPPGGLLVLETFGNFGFLIHSFVMGVQLDAILLRSIGKKAMAIGLSATIVAFAFGFFAFVMVQLIDGIQNELKYGIQVMVTVNSISYFISTTGVLGELDILNSEMGRMATSASLVSDATGWFVAQTLPSINIALNYSTMTPVLSFLILLAYYCTIFFVLRPLVVQMVECTPEGKPMRTSHFFSILLMVFGVGVLGDYSGQHAALGVFFFGLSLPAGPPLSSTLVQKLSTMASGVLLPVFCSVSGLKTDISTARTRSWVFIELIIVAGYVGKFTGTILSSLYFDFGLRDASLLALIMSFKGIIEIAMYSSWLDSRFINREMFTLLIISTVLVTAICGPIVSNLYDPSTKYMAQKGATATVRYRQMIDLRLLVCIHGEENVPTIISFLEASNPTRDNPISVFILQLMDLDGRATAFLAPVLPQDKPTSKLNHSERIAIAFKNFEWSSHSRVGIYQFAAVAPYASMHDDICTLALDKQTSIVIIPYHKRWGIDGTVEAVIPSIRLVNENVINKAPCSVGVLVDRSRIGGNQPVLVTGSSLYRIAVLFLGGADDREALEYSRRMAGHPNIRLTVVWLKSLGYGRDQDEKEKSLDGELMHDLKADAMGGEKIVYREENVKDGVGTTRIIRTMEEAFDLFVVGRRHDPESPVTLGLTEWSECPELGIIGDMLTTSDFQFSVLVMQHSK